MNKLLWASFALNTAGEWMTHPDAKLLSDIEAAKKMMQDEQSNKGQLRGIIKSMQQAIKLRKAKR